MDAKVNIVVKPPSDPPSTRSRSRPSARTVSEAVGGSVDASSVADEARDGSTGQPESQARHHHTLRLSRQSSVGGGLLGVTNAKSFRSSRLAVDQDDDKAMSTTAVDASSTRDVSAVDHDRDGTVCISESARTFLMNVQGFNQSKAAVDATALAVLPNNYMKKYPSFAQKEKMAQMALGTGATAGLTLATLRQAAATAMPKFADIMRSIVLAAGLAPDEVATHNGNPLVLDERAGLVFKRLTLAPVKSESRCVEKVLNEYGGDYGKLVDLVRCSIVVSSEEQLESVVRALVGGNGEGDRPTAFEVVRCKNRFATPLFNGYRDALYNVRVRLDDGAGADGVWHVCEAQLHLAAVLSHKEESHVYYEYFRTYFHGEVGNVKSKMATLERLVPPDAPVRDGGNTVHDGGAASLADLLIAAATTTDDECQLSSLAVLFGKDMTAEFGLLEIVQRRRLEISLQSSTAGKPYNSNARLERRLDYCHSLLLQGRHDRAAATLEEAWQEWEAAAQTTEEARATDSEAEAERLDLLGTFYSMSGLAAKGRGLIKQAEEQFRLALELDESNENLVNVADVLLRQKRYFEAEELYTKALVKTETEKSPDHPDTGMALNNLALVYELEGNVEEAEASTRRALEIWERSLGPDHPDTATALENLSSLLYLAGKVIRDQPFLAAARPSSAAHHTSHAQYDDAEPLIRRSLAIREEQLGKNNSMTALSVSKLGVVLRDMGRTSEAVPLLRRALTLGEASFGPDNEETRNSIVNLASCLAERTDGVAGEEGCGGVEEREEAIALYRRALGSQRKATGDDHVQTATAMAALAALLVESAQAIEAEDEVEEGEGGGILERFEEAEHLYTTVVTIREKRLGLDAPETIAALKNLAVVLHDGGEKLEEAELVYRKLVKVLERVVPAQRWLTPAEEEIYRDDPDQLVGRRVQVDTIGVGVVKAFAKKSGGAANFLQDSKHSILFSGDKEPRTVLLRRRKLGHWNGGLLFRIVPEEVECAIMDRPDGAGDAAAGNAGEGLGTEAGGDETITRTLNLAASMEDLATCLNDQDKLVEAEAMYRKALSLRTKAVGYEHLDTQAALRSLVEFLEDLGPEDNGATAESEGGGRQARIAALRDRFVGAI